MVAMECGVTCTVYVHACLARSQLVYKWSHSRAVVAPALADQYRRLIAAGWPVSEALGRCSYPVPMTIVRDEPQRPSAEELVWTRRAADGACVRLARVRAGARPVRGSGGQPSAPQPTCGDLA